MELAALVDWAIAPATAGEPLRFKHEVNELPCSRNGIDRAVANDALGDALGMRLVSKLDETSGQLGDGELGELIRGGAGQTIIHPHVQRSIVLVTEATIGVVDLHARNAQVGKDDVETVEAFASEDLSKPGEMAVMEANLTLADGRCCGLCAVGREC